MSLTNLATSADLALRGVDTGAHALDTIDALLGSASEAVRTAAGHPITELTSTVVLEGKPSRTLFLPSLPVTDVDSVSVDGEATTSFRVLPGGRLWRIDGLWSPTWEPTLVTVTYTHGYAVVPADVVDLVCGLVAGALAAVNSGYDPGIGVQSVRVDDASETYATGDAARGGVMELPPMTVAGLQAKFGGGVHVAAVVSR